MLEELERCQKGLTLHLYFGSGPDLVRRVRSLEIDLAVTSTRIVDPKLDGAPLHQERYTFVGHPALLRALPLVDESTAKAHTLFDTTEELPLYRYFRDAAGGLDSRAFGRVVRLGTIAAIRHQVLARRGVAVLPLYFVSKELAARRVVPLFPKVELLVDHFRLIHRVDDPRRGLYSKLAALMRDTPLS